MRLEPPQIIEMIIYLERILTTLILPILRTQLILLLARRHLTRCDRINNQRLIQELHRNLAAIQLRESAHSQQRCLTDRIHIHHRNLNIRCRSSINQRHQPQPMAVNNKWLQPILVRYRNEVKDSYKIK